MCQNEARRNETIVKISNAIVGASLSVAACSAAALSLGNSRGSVVLGAPIDLSFEVGTDPGSDVASSCVSAKLVSGGTPIPDSRITITPVDGGRTPMVRVRSTVPADEPVLTATLTAGCNGPVTRTYTFLADLPGTPPAANRPVDIAQLSPASPAGTARSGLADRNTGAPAGPTRSTPRDGAATAPVDSSSAPVRAARPRAEAAGTAPRPPRQPASAPRASVPAVEPKPRLVMVPLEEWLDAPLPLRSTAELPAVPDPSGGTQRAEAAALWKALNATPEEARDAAARLAKLEADGAAQRSRGAQDRAAVADLQQRLDAAESERFPALVVYGLLALLVLALGLLVWVWSRARRSVEQAWQHSVAVTAEAHAHGGMAMHGPDDADDLHTKPQPADAWARDAFPAVAPALASAVVAPPPPVPRPPVAEPPARIPDAVHLPELTEEFGHLGHAPAVAVAAPAPATAAAPRHIVHPEELFDIQQQAEFFVSVGEHDQAIEVLRQHIADHGSTSPFAYLELLRLFHTLSRADSFQQLRAQFQQHFNARVPEFASFHRTGRTLEDYPEALAAIEAQWSATDVIDIIEGFIFRKPEGAPVEPFDMAAYDDLLLLLAIAQTTPANQRGLPPPRPRTTPLGAGPSAAFAGAAVAPVAAAAAAAVAGSSVREADPFAPPSLLDTGDLAMMPFDDAVPMAPPVRAGTGKPLQAPSLDSLMGDLTLESLPGALSQRPAFSESALDLDLSDPPPLTLSDLPPLPVTAPPAPDEPLGFGLDDDKLEVRLEMEKLNKRNTDGQ